MNPYDQDFVDSKIDAYLSDLAYAKCYNDDYAMQDAYGHWLDLVSNQPLTLVVRKTTAKFKEDNSTIYRHNLFDYKTGWWFNRVEVEVMDGNVIDVSLPLQIAGQKDVLSIDRMNSPRRSNLYWYSAVRQAHYWAARKFRPAPIP